MKKLFTTFLVTMFSIVALGQNITIEDWKYWNPIMESVAQVESNKTSDAISKSGRYVGYLQISPILVKECNRIAGTQYTLDDRYNVQKSKEMFIIIQKRYNKQKSFEKAVRIWNGGPKGYLLKSTYSYYKKVLGHYNQLAKI